ncbi:MAG: ABC transporter permease subunit [Anaerolineae bacterium]|nr:ABC transporter permease subunit [Anaerolineae bacterium]NIN97202.1 ABC transporter permease subunit [Anaerolineae bacterium]NIQ82820.1 ABC transporter permease subunit [Anaerolineae bacterium]
MRRWIYLVRRLALAALVLLSVSIITFFISRVVPSNPAAKWVGPHPTQEQIAAARIKLGLDKPLYAQYFVYMGDLLRGDFGVSVRTHQPIIEDLKTYLPATLELVVVSTILALVIGLPFGVLSGARKNSLLDHLSRLLAIAGVSMPVFWIALLLQLFFFGKLGILPLGGRVDNAITIYHPVQQITGFYLIDSLVTGNLPAFRSSLVHIILPAFVLGLYAIGLTIRMTRSTMVEVLEEGYITAARAAGIPERTILFRLALKNAIIPTLTVVALSFVYSVTGAILVEVIFSWPGLGRYVTEAVLGVDFPVIMAVTLVVTVLYVFINLFMDLLQAFLDPRVTLG